MGVVGIIAAVVGATAAVGGAYNSYEQGKSATKAADRARIEAVNQRKKQEILSAEASREQAKTKEIAGAQKTRTDAKNKARKVRSAGGGGLLTGGDTGLMGGTTSGLTSETTAGLKNKLGA